MIFIKTGEFSWISISFTAVPYSVCFALFLAFPFEKCYLIDISEYWKRDLNLFDLPLVKIIYYKNIIHAPT